MALESLFDEGLFLFCGHVVEDGLDRVSALLVTANLYKVVLDQI